MRTYSLRMTVVFFTLSVIAASVSGQNTMSRSMIQYLFPDFCQSVVLMKNGDKKTTVMNFNTVTESLVFISDGKYYDMKNPEIIDTVYLNGCKFVAVGKAFYEILASSPMPLFIQHKGDLVEKGVPVGYGGTSQLAKSVYITSFDSMGGTYNLELPENFTVRPAPIYWIRKGSEMLSFTNQKQYLNLFPGKADDIKSFIKDYKLKFSEKEDMVKIVNYSANL